MKIFHCDHCGHLLFFENTDCVELRPPRRLPAGPAAGRASTGTRTGEPTAAGARRCRRRPTAGTGSVQNYKDRRQSATGPCRRRRRPALRVVPAHAGHPESRGPGPPRRVVPPRSRQAASAVHADGARPAGAATGPTIRSAGWRSSFSRMPGGERAGADRARRRRHHHQHRRGRRRRARAAAHGDARAVSDAARAHAARERALLLGSPASRRRPELDAFRSLFGDERADYAAALATYYDSGAPADWQDRFVSAYASAHPWEDWAETWAHYLHMVDTLETAAACGLSLRPRRRDEPSLPDAPEPVSPQPAPFSAPDRQLVSADLRAEQPESRARAPRCVPVRPLAAAVAKLRFVDDVVGRVKVGGAREPTVTVAPVPNQPHA